MPYVRKVNGVVVELYHGEPYEGVPGTWSKVRDDHADVKTYLNAGLAIRMRDERNGKLRASDWTQLPDVQVDASAWQTYRQALRDVPAQQGFPANITWPVEP